MRPVHSRDYFTTGTATEQIRATIDVENTVHIMGQLSDVYSDRVLAVEREYSTNAYDSHVAAGVDRPIEVRLPTVDHLFFEVEDFGLGLGIEELRHVYLSYGASDKRERDDLVGALGFGSKAASAYAPLGWQVTAVKDGEKVVATVAKDPEGVPTMHILHRGPTTEGNGVKITVPVDAGDDDTFRDTAESFFRFWKPGTVLVDGKAPESIWDDERLTWVDESVALRHGGRSYVIMGNVGYPVARKTKWGQTVIAEVPMGSVEFTPSREALKMSDVTTETLDDLFDFAEHHAEAALVAEIQNAPTPWEAVSIYARHCRAFDYYVERDYKALVAPHLPQMYPVVDAFTYKIHSHRNAVTSLTRISPALFDAGRDYESARRIGIVTHYPWAHSDNIATARRHHLKEWARDKGLNTVVVLPGGIDGFEFLQGWTGETITWAEAKDTYPRPKAERGTGGRGKTVYDRYVGGYQRIGWAEGEWNDTDEVVLYTTNSAAWYSSRHPEAHVASLRHNQVDKFVRLHPTALEATVYDHQRIEFVTSLIDDTVRLAVHGGAWDWAAEVVDRIADPDVVAIVTAKHDVADVLAECKRLRITVDRPDSIDALWERYPLLGRLARWEFDEQRDEIVLYMNAKYEALTVEALLASIDAEAADVSVEEES